MAERTVGVEEEFLLVRPGFDAMAAEGDEVVALATEREAPTIHGDAVSEPFEHELMREQAELGTPPCRSIGDLTVALQGLRERLAAAAFELGARLVASGTNPLSGPTTTTADGRYERMGREFGLTARQQLSCGMHVHVAVDSRDEGVAVLDRIRPWLAILTALSTNSPFWQGEDTGYSSYRTQLWGQWPTAGPVEAFGDVAGYARATADLIASGAALDDGMIYFDARLSASYPTVEIRVADVCPVVSEAALLAALARGLIATAARRWREGDRPDPVRVDLLRAAQWRAARWGMTADLVDPAAPALMPAWSAAARLLEWTRTELAAAGDVERVEAGLADLRRRGTGAERQRATWATSGHLPAVLRSLAVGDRPEVTSG